MANDSGRRPIELIEARLYEVSDGGVGTPGNLSEALRYALLGGGKRVRPLLVWHSCGAAGGDPEKSLPACAAVELVHAFSLVHDDLPALDNDDLRRGRATLHRHAGEAMALLAGDALLLHAFRVLLSQGSPGVRAALMSTLAEATWKMVAGQVYDTVGGFAEFEAASDRVRRIHELKTGALIEGACRMGALSAGTPAGAAAEASFDAIAAFGRAAGLMFQIVDDILDVTQPTLHAGKRTGKDREAGKLTYPGVFGLEGSKAQARALREQALAAIAPLGERGAGLRDLCDWMADRTN